MDIKNLYEAFKKSSGVTTDSRSINGGEMFFAIKGDNFDGNEYAAAALENGALCAVVDEGSPAALSGDPRVFVSTDSLKTLQDLARWHREHSLVDGNRLTVIGLTGTNGKTTTKELITRTLSVKYRVTSTQGNLNNDIGVPLSVLKINADTQIAVIEMGASHPDDIARLVTVCGPDYGLVTNVGKAHLLGFGSFDGVKKAKGQLYDYILSVGGKVFINADDVNLMGMAASRPGLKMIEYGVRHWGAIVLPSDADHPFVRMAVPERSGALSREEETENLIGLETHLTGAYNADNILAALAVALHFDVPLEDAVQAVSEYVPVNNRSQLVKTQRNVLIEDAYNANPTSMNAALDNLALVQSSAKAAFLGDMRELGAESHSEHSAVLSKVLSMGLDLVCLVGDEFGSAAKDSAALPPNVKCFPDSTTLASWLKDNPASGLTILVKGSRGIQMEKVLPEL